MHEEEKGQFWETQAKKYKENTQAVNFDPLVEEQELFFLDQLVGDKELVCDLGCGNGRTLIYLATKKKNSLFYGVDFAEEMIKVAEETKKKLNVTNVHFYHFDSSSKDLPKLFNFKFDKVITKRLLINLKGEDKYKAIENIYSLMKEQATYLMVECFIEPLNRINEIRRGLNLDEIKVKFFNEYLSLSFLDEIKDKFVVTQKIDFGSFYYFISRIFNAYLSNGTPDYFAPINRLAVELTKMGVSPIEGYSPEIIIVLKKSST